MCTPARGRLCIELAAALLLLGGCATPAPLDPITVAGDLKRSPVARVEALRVAWAEVESGRLNAAAVRPETKEIAWSPANAPGLRLAAFDWLLNSASAADLEDTRAMIKLRLPRETSPPVVAYLCGVAAERGWVDASAAIVRAWSQPMDPVKDDARPERRALAALHPAREPRETVMAIFLDPREASEPASKPASASAEQAEQERRVRADAWTLLDRLDPDGSFRLARLQDPTVEPSASTLPTWRALVAAWADFKVLPRHGNELQWLMQLREEATRDGQAWWASAKAAGDSSWAAHASDDAGGVELRHIEPLRWASVHEPSWLRLSRDELRAMLTSELSGRITHQRDRREDENFGVGPVDERFETWRDRLAWADGLAILVIDRALRAPESAAALFAQAALDREDRGTEYGGALSALEAAFKWSLYIPRPGAREGDEKFIAPADMINQSARSLAHYHFHAQRPRNAEYAGPSRGDLEYGQRHGRTCLVLTSVDEGVMNVDVFTPSGVVIDLGELRLESPREESARSRTRGDRP
jgi:hypothetical protein